MRGKKMFRSTKCRVSYPSQFSRWSAYQLRRIVKRAPPVRYVVSVPSCHPPECRLCHACTLCSQLNVPTRLNVVDDSVALAVANSQRRETALLSGMVQAGPALGSGTSGPLGGIVTAIAVSGSDEYRRVQLTIADNAAGLALS